jgi:D-alanine-D-alanine ligase
MSEESRAEIQKSLAKSYKTVGITLVDNESDLEELIQTKPDMVFLGMASIPKKPTATSSSPCIWLAEALNKNDIIYTGSAVDAMMTEADKLKAKKVVKKADLSTAPFFMAYTGQFTSESQLVLPFPLFIKPPKLGIGVGVDGLSIVRNYREYKTKIAKLDKEFDSESLVEAYLTGREFTVAILQKPKEEDKEVEYQVMPIELQVRENANGDRILDHKARSLDAECTQSVSDNPTLKKELSDLALACFDAIGAKDYGRIDIRCDADGTPYFLGANLIPNIAADSSHFQKACELNTKLTYDDMLTSIVALGFEGHVQYVAPVIVEKEPVTSQPAAVIGK